MSKTFHASVGNQDNRVGYEKCERQFQAVLEQCAARGLLKESLEAMAGLIQLHSCGTRIGNPNLRNSAAIDYIMRGVTVALQDDRLDRGRADYIIRNLKQGTDILASSFATPTER